MRKPAYTPPYQPPRIFRGTPLREPGPPMELNGEIWVTLTPEDEHSDRIWEFSLTTGRLLGEANAN